MKISKILVVLAAVIIWGCASKPEKIESARTGPEAAEERGAAKEQSEKNAAETAVEKDPLKGRVREVYDRFEAAWEKGDLAAYLALYAEDYMAGYDEDRLFTPKKGLAVLVGEMMGLSYPFHRWTVQITITDAWKDEDGNIRASTRQKQAVDGERWYDGPGPEAVFVDQDGELLIWREYVEPSEYGPSERFLGEWICSVGGADYGRAYVLDIGSDQFGNLKFLIEHQVNFEDTAGSYDTPGWVPYAENGGALFMPEGEENCIIFNMFSVTVSEFDLEEQFIYGGYGPLAERDDAEYKKLNYRIFPEGSNIYNPAFRYTLEGDELSLVHISDNGNDPFPDKMVFRRRR